eukprot:CAMPEP_0174261246 /NCGR_PEP_ID=MMETSP0439-20130205/11323_1 /TAXON_ID=0 /ORGANISM="Stereomyxa ramosa, Strain Chinc5" /LENGTH=239 /DNA_ID=CAMNT_0015345699 /DNA_START=103 /DNA_END=822 /DNA_ORIENTATION=-
MKKPVQQQYTIQTRRSKRTHKPEEEELDNLASCLLENLTPTTEEKEKESTSMELYELATILCNMRNPKSAAKQVIDEVAKPAEPQARTGADLPFLVLPPPVSGTPSFLFDHQPGNSNKEQQTKRKRKREEDDEPEAGLLSQAAPPKRYSKQPKTKRRRASAEQVLKMEKLFKTDPYPTTERRKQLEQEIGLHTRKIQIWFQNRRAKLKREQRHGRVKPSGCAFASPGSSTITVGTTTAC